MEEMRFLLLTDRSNLYYYASSSKRSQYGSLLVYRLGPNIFSSVYYSSRLKGRILEKLSLMSLFQEAISLQLLKEVDIFHLHGVWLYKEYKQYMDLALLLSRSFNRPLVVSLHGDVISELGDEGMPLFNSKIIELLNHAKAVTTFSKSVMDGLHKLGVGSKSYLIPNFIDIETFRPPIPRDYKSATNLLVVSRLDPEKDLTTVIKAFKYVKEKISDSSLTIIGYGSKFNELQHLVHSIGLSDSIIFKGLCSETVKKKALWKSDIFIATRASYIATLEAWASGLPVVGCGEGIIMQIISHGKNGVLFRPGDPKKLAKVLSKIMENQTLRKKLALGGMQTVKKYDVRNIAPKIKEIYRYCMN
jgi:glycosyltransferase involved in cell wall biosynthesis